MRVLVVEDDPVLAEVVHATLEAVGHEVIAAVATGEEAVSLARIADPDVVVMDVGLAGALDGIEAARRLRRRKRCPVVFHTAYQDPEHHERMRAVEDATIVTKPGHIERLVDAVNAAAGEAR